MALCAGLEQFHTPQRSFLVEEQVRLGLHRDLQSHLVGQRRLDCRRGLIHGQDCRNTLVNRSLVETSSGSAFQIILKEPRRSKILEMNGWQFYKLRGDQGEIEEL